MIKCINISDLDTIKQFEAHFSDEGNYNISQITSMLNNHNYHNLGVYENNVLIGYLFASVTCNSVDIIKVFIDEMFRRKGYASLLIKHLFNCFTNHTFHLEVYEQNIPAIRLYKTLNFKQINVRINYYGNGKNAIIMTKE